MNVNRVDFQYDDVTKVASLSNKQGLASLPGADGIIFSGPNTILVGGQGNFVHQLNMNANNTSVLSSSSATAGAGASFHLALDPSGTSVYTSPFNGPLETLALTPNVQPGTVRAVTGDESGLTQEGFAANAGNKAFYVTGSPNGFGNAGLLGNLYGVGPVTTTRLITGAQSIHGMVYDPFTGLMTFFGAGRVGSLDPTLATNAAMAASFKQSGQINADFDQGAVDGSGHAFIAGNGQITFIDYSATGDITSALNVIQIFGGFNGIDDVAPLVGPGAPTGVPEPASIFLLAAGGLGLLAGRRLRRKPS